jgi:cold shock CspA family protein
MQIPVQVTFGHMSASEAVEANIREWVAELEGLCERITSCRVMIEAPHGHHHQGRLYRVRIDLGVPTRHIVVGRSPGAHHAHEDVNVALRDAFHAIRRRLEDYVRRIRGQVKPHETPRHGRVIHLEPNRAHGRLLTDDDREVYFHRNSVLGGIDHLELGTEVRFHEEMGNEGPQASSVEPVGAQGHHVLGASEPKV